MLKSIQVCSICNIINIMKIAAIAIQICIQEGDLRLKLEFTDLDELKAEACLELSRTSTMELFCKNS